MADKDIREASLEYHRQLPPGKISLLPTKQLTNQRDLALAYTPGVAAACDEIVRDPAEARNLTARQSDRRRHQRGTAVLGLGAIGPPGRKPVMEGKAVLFKKFAGIDCLTSRSTARPGSWSISSARSSPRCGDQSRGHQGTGMLLRRAQVPRADEDSGISDDQHGTAIIVGAAVVNGLRVVGKDLAAVKLACSGARRGCAPVSICWSAWHQAGKHLGRGHLPAWCGGAARKRWTRTRRATPPKPRPIGRDIITGADTCLVCHGAGLKPEFLTDRWQSSR